MPPLQADTVIKGSILLCIMLQTISLNRFEFSQRRKDKNRIIVDKMLIMYRNPKMIVHLF